MIRECREAGCSTLTMGELCLEHERELELDLRRTPDFSGAVLDRRPEDVVDEALRS